MATLTNKSSGLEIDYKGSITYIKYDNLKVLKRGNSISFYDDSEGGALGQEKLSIPFSEVTSPLEDNIDDLYNVIINYIDSFAGNNLGDKSILNSTTSILTSGSTFTGVAELNDFPDVMVTIKSDQNGTLYTDFSTDGTNWDSTLSFNYNVDRINPPHILVKAGRYFRVRFTNTSSSDQTTLRVSTYYGSFNKLTAPINGTLSEVYDATVVRPTEYRYEVAMGKRQGRTTVNKWGYNLDVDTASEEIIAPFGGAFDPNTAIMSTAQTFTIAFNNATDGLGTTGATSLVISYLDADYNLQDAVHVLSNTGSDVTAFTGFGINRVVVLSNGGAGWNVNNITLTATSDGTTQAQVPSLKSVTQQCIFHTPINHNFLIDWGKGNMLKISGGGGAPVVTVIGYSWSRVTNTRYEIFREDIDASVENHLIVEPSQPFIVGGREVIYFACSTDTNNTTIKFRFSGILERVN